MPLPAQQRAVVALQAALEAPEDLPLEAAQHPLGRQERGGVHDARAARLRRVRSTTSGTGTLARTASMTCSGVDVVAERLVGQDEPVPQHVRCDRANVLGQHVLAAAHERQRPGRERPC